MHTVEVNIDEEVVCKIHPEISSVEDLRNWAQDVIDCYIDEMTFEDTQTMDVEAARKIVREVKEYSRK